MAFSGMSCVIRYNRFESASRSSASSSLINLRSFGYCCQLEITVVTERIADKKSDKIFASLLKTALLIECSHCILSYIATFLFLIVFYNN